MELKVSKGLNKPLTELDESQQKRFINELSKDVHSHDFKFGMEIALLILGYKIKA